MKYELTFLSGGLIDNYDKVLCDESSVDSCIAHYEDMGFILIRTKKLDTAAGGRA